MQSVTPSRRATALPRVRPISRQQTALPVTVLLPTLSSTYTDPDGQSGYVTYTVKRPDGSTAASGHGSSVASGTTSNWSVPAGSLVAGVVYNWYAQAFDASGASSASVGGYSYGPDPIEMTAACEADANSIADTSSCIDSTQPTQPAAPADTCTGTDSFCDASLAEIQAAGIDTTELSTDSDTDLAGNADLIARGGQAPEGGGGGYTGRWALLLFELTRGNSSTCSGNPIIDNGYCGTLWHIWTQLNNGTPSGGQHNTMFYSRSGGDWGSSPHGCTGNGGNNPAVKWLPFCGPIPDVWDHSTGPSGQAYHHWGWTGGNFKGYWADSDVSYSPGRWHIDPAKVWSAGGVGRDGFFIHGGIGAHAYDQSGTEGCIRLKVQGILALKAKWYNSTDNKHQVPGPTIYQYYQP
jgi:hypothetical protein